MLNLLRVSCCLCGFFSCLTACKPHSSNANSETSYSRSSRLENMRAILKQEEKKLEEQNKKNECGYFGKFWGYFGYNASLPKDKTPEEISLEHNDIFFITHEETLANVELQNFLATRYDASTGNTKLTIEDLKVAVKQGYVKREDVPMGVLMKYMYSSGYLSSLFRTVANFQLFSQIAGAIKNRNASEKDIINFVKNILNIQLGSCNIDAVNQDFMEKYGKGLGDFATINEIFARKYTPSYMQTLLTKFGAKKGDIVSNSTARIRFTEIKDVDENFHLTDKNIGGEVNSFNVRKLFGNNNSDEQKILDGTWKADVKYFEEHPNDNDSKFNIELIYAQVLQHALTNLVKGNLMIVNRLAPVDYHNFHFPFTKGKVLSLPELAIHVQSKINSIDVPKKYKEVYKEVTQYLSKKENIAFIKDPVFHLTGKYLSVSTIATSSSALKYNPLIENVRDLFFVDTPDYGVIPFFIIGATGVGTNIINLTSGQELKMGDPMGYFEFGGSTVIMFIPKDKIQAYSPIELLQNVIYQIPGETNSEKLRNMEVFLQVGTPLFNKILGQTP